VYKWLSTSEKIPLVEISGTEVAGNFAPQYIRYRDNHRSKPISVKAHDKEQISIYPTPASENLVIANPLNQNLQFRIIDLPGKTVQTGTLKANSSTSLAISNMPNGSYFIIFEGDNWSSNRRLVIQH
jgi:hypothetical protein